MNSTIASITPESVHWLDLALDLESAAETTGSQNAARAMRAAAAGLRTMGGAMGPCASPAQPPKLSEKYPRYYRAVPPGVDPAEVDTYALNVMFPVDDPTGCILHARKKLLIPGVRSGGKRMADDVREAYDTFGRYLALTAPLGSAVPAQPQQGER